MTSCRQPLANCVKSSKVPLCVLTDAIACPNHACKGSGTEVIPLHSRHFKSDANNEQQYSRMLAHFDRACETVFLAEAPVTRELVGPPSSAATSAAAAAPWAVSTSCLTW